MFCAYFKHFVLKESVSVHIFCNILDMQKIPYSSSRDQGLKLLYASGILPPLDILACLGSKDQVYTRYIQGIAQ